MPAPAAWNPGSRSVSRRYRAWHPPHLHTWWDGEEETKCGAHLLQARLYSLPQVPVHECLAYVQIPQQKVPMVHRIHDEVVEFVERFFAAFIPVKKLKELTPSGLKGLDVSNPEFHRPLPEVFLGQDTEAIVIQWTGSKLHGRHSGPPSQLATRSPVSWLWCYILQEEGQGGICTDSQVYAGNGIGQPCPALAVSHRP